MPFPLAAAAIMGGSSILGSLLGRQKSPAVAPFQAVDIQDEQKRAIAGNIANQGDIEALLSRANKYTQQQATDLMEQAMPGWSKLQNRYMELNQELLKDPYSLPKDVEQNLERLAAERGISAGTRGQFNDYSLIRDFGINSLQYGQSRINQAQSISQLIGSLAPRVNPLSPMSMYVTPQQAISTQQANNAGQQATQQAAYNAQAGASNYNASMWGNLVSNLGGLAGFYLNSQANNTVSTAQTPNSVTPSSIPKTAYNPMVGYPALYPSR